MPIHAKIAPNRATREREISAKSGPCYCGFCPLRGLLRRSMGAEPFYYHCTGIFEACESYDAVRGSTSCRFMPKQTETRLQIAVSDEIELVSVY